MSKDRETYAVCGAAMRQALERAFAAGCTRKQLRALGAIFGWTVAWSRLEEEVYVAEIARDAGLHIVDARAALRRLREVGVIEYEGRRNRPSRVALLRGDSASFGKRGESASFATPGGDSAPLAGGDPASQSEADPPLRYEKSREVSDLRACARATGVCPECEIGLRASGGRHVEGCSLASEVQQ